MNFGVLSYTIFLPLLGAVVVALIPKKYSNVAFGTGLGVAVLTVVLSLFLFFGFSVESEGFQFRETVSWIPTYGVQYAVGVDGISLVLIVLTTFLSVASLVAALNVIKERVHEFVASMLLLETAMIGTFAALDIFLFYVFWEAMLIPMYLLIGVFGGPRRIYATLKFFLYTMGGSVLMLVGILAMYSIHREQFGLASASFADLYRVSLPLEPQVVFFLLFLVAFAIKIPIFPFHTWLPDAHVEAPTAGSVILAGVLLKMGGYGILRLAIPMFPAAAIATAPYVATLGVIGILYGAMVAWAQADIKKLIAYSSVSHMGFVVLGLASLQPSAMSGAVFQMIAHGVSTGGLFLLVGVLYDRRHTRMLADFGGLAKVTPRFAAAFLLITLASIGLPGLCGFVGEFMILTGSFQSSLLLHPTGFVVLSVLGIVLGAAYMLMMYERIFFGKVKFEENQHLKDLTFREALALAAPIIFSIWLGLQPGIVLSRVNPAVNGIVRTAVLGVQVAELGRGPQ